MISANLLGCSSCSVVLRARGEAQAHSIARKSRRPTNNDTSAASACSRATPTTHVVLEELQEVGAEGGMSEVRRLELRLRTCPSANTGGFLWNCGNQLSRWLFARRALLKGRNVLELGCGLGLPSFVASGFAALTVATDYEPALMDLFRLNAANNSILVAAEGSPRQKSGLATAVLDFTSATSVRSIGLGMWDLVLFTDCIYNGQAGEALPHVLLALLRCDGIAIGVFPPEKRPGIEAFWEVARAAGITWVECNLDDGPAATFRGGDTEEAISDTAAPRCRLYAFWGPRGQAGDGVCRGEEVNLEELIGEPEEEVADVEPLFSSI